MARDEARGGRVLAAPAGVKRRRPGRRSGSGIAATTTDAAVEVHCVDGRIAVSAMARWDIAAWGGTDAIEVVAETVSDTGLGQRIDRLLELSTTATVDRGPGSAARLLEALAVRSHRELVRRARLVHVRREGDRAAPTVTLIPSVPDAGGGGWVSAGPGEALVLIAPTTAELGAAVRTALSRSGPGDGGGSAG